MAYVPSALKLIAGRRIDRTQPRLWSYKTTDSLVTVRAANYFSDALNRDVRAGDTIWVEIVNGSDVPQGRGALNVYSVGASGAVVTTGVQELTASGAVLAGTTSLELNHTGTIIAATMVATEHPGLFVVKDTSATGTIAHTLTLTGGTFNGTATVATLNLRDEMLVVWFDSAGRGQVVSNVGSVALS